MTDNAAAQAFAAFMRQATGQDETPPDPVADPEPPPGPRPDPSQGAHGTPTGPANPWEVLAELVQDQDRGDGKGGWVDVAEAAHRHRNY